MATLPTATVVKEICITFRSKKDAKNHFKNTIHALVKCLDSFTPWYMISPELTKVGDLHYHILFAYVDAKRCQLSYCMGKFRKWGLTKLYELHKTHDDILAKVTTECEFGACKCFDCRQCYILKDMIPMSELLCFDLPVKADTPKRTMAPFNQEVIKRERKAKNVARLEHAFKYLKADDIMQALGNVKAGIC